jgi:cytoskeleton protein RodZ
VPTLKQAREQAGLHVVALAAMLKVPVNKLEALEAGRYADLPDMTFARALAKSVCRQLKIDPAPILAGLPQSTPVELGHLPKALNTSMPRLPSGTARAEGRHLPWPAAIATLLVVVAGVLWWALPASGPVAVTTPAVLEPVPTPVYAPAPATVALPEAAATVAPAAPTAPTAPTAPPAPTESGVPVLQLHATHTAWVEVVGRSGRLLIQRTLQAGETVSFQDDAPYAVVTGRADATEVVVRGQAFDLTPVVRNNVARFQVQ